MNHSHDRLRAYFGGEHFDLDPTLPRRALAGLRRSGAGTTDRRAAGAPLRWRWSGRPLAWPWATAALAVLLVVSLVWATLASAANAPGRTALDWALREAGLTHAEQAGVHSGHVLAQASVDGGTVRVLAVEADALRTVIVLDGSADVHMPSMVHVIDETGRELGALPKGTAPGGLLEAGGGPPGETPPARVWEILAPGPPPARVWEILTLGPLPAGTHRLTLTAVGMDGRPSGPALTFPVRVPTAAVSPVSPAGGRLGPLDVRIAAIASEDIMMIDIESTSDFPRLGPGQDVTVKVLGPGGQPLGGTGPGTMGMGGPDGLDIVTTHYYQPAGRGTYRLQLAFQGHSMESTFTVR